MEKVRQKGRSEGEIRRFQFWILWLHLVAVAVLGLSLFPMVLFLHAVWHAMGAYGIWLKTLVFSLSVAAGYFLFGTTLILLSVLAKGLFGFRIAPGLYPWYSVPAMRWMGYNSLILLTNGAFLDVLRLSPFQILFYRVMGARIGRDVNVNTGGLADLAMLEIGDHTVIGGGVALICHAADRGFLRLEPTRVGRHVSVGLGSVIMPGCQIGDYVSIAPCSYLPRGTRVPDRSVWGGNPARDLRAERRAEAGQDQ